MTDLLAALESADPLVVQDALDQVATQAIAASTRRRNAIAAVLGITAQADEDEGDGDEDDDEDRDYDDYDDEDDETDDEADEGDDETNATIHAGPLPPLDHALDFHLGQIAPATLAHLFRALFHDCHDDFPAAVRVAAEVTRRGDDAVQLALVDAFIAANAHHHTGHRTDDQVHDVLLDEVFPTLGPAALTHLLAWCSNGHLDDATGDRMFGLFHPALTSADPGQRAILLRRLESFLRELTELEPDHASALWASLETLTGPALADVRALRHRLERGLDRTAIPPM